MKKRLFGIAAAVAFVCGGSLAGESGWTTITNGEMWQDESGKDVQAHGAGFLKVGDTWYMIGEDRSDQWHPDVNMYSSKDLVNWKFERKIIENGVTHPDLGDARMIERPKLLYCAKTGKFVVWCHWEARNYGASEAGVFYSDTVNGEYKFYWGGRPLGVKSRDCNVFVDDDGTAYFISTIEENQHLGLFKLSDDYLSAVEYTELFKGQSREAPAIVKVDGIYYMLSSACTGWDPNPCKLSWSKSLTSGWTELEQIGNPIAYDTQAASILTIDGTKGKTYLYVGDRWQDPTLPESKTIIFPISFGEGKCEFSYTPQFDINFTTGECRPTASTRISGHDKVKHLVQEPGKCIVDLGSSHHVKGFMVRHEENLSKDQVARKYELHTSKDGRQWAKVTSGEWLPYEAEVRINPTEARYLKLVFNDNNGLSVNNIEVLAD